MVYNLIADAGSTKTEWVMIDAAGGYVKPFRTVGLNALTASDEEACGVLSEARQRLPEDADIESVQYYGAGCATPRTCDRMKRLISGIFECEHVEVQSDLVGAARSLLGHEHGIACILGTGSNSCLYDGSKIVANTPSLGYVVGDEGSGNAIGRRLLSDYFKKKMPAETAGKFAAHPAADLATSLQNIYREPGANRWLASLANFATENMSDTYIRNLVKDEFHRFIDRNVATYFDLTDKHTTPVCFTGGIAATFAPLLEAVCDEESLYLEQITSAPIQGLVRQWLTDNSL